MFDNTTKTSTDFDINDTPRGAWIKTKGDRNIIGASMRSYYAFFTVPFASIWCFSACKGRYESFVENGGFLPSLIHLDVLFGVGSIAVFFLALMTVFGKVELTLDANGGKIFTGIWMIGWVQKFLWCDVKSLRTQPNESRFIGNHRREIVLEGKKTLIFGSRLIYERLMYITNTTHELMHKYKSSK